MNNEKLNVLLFAFRYAVHRIPTQSLAAIQSELVENLHECRIGCWNKWNATLTGIFS